MVAKIINQISKLNPVTEKGICYTTWQVRFIPEGWIFVGGGGGGNQMSDGCQLVQTSSYKINESWGCSVQRGDYS